MNKKQINIWGPLLAGAITLICLLFCNRVYAQDESLKRILGVQTQIAQLPCDTIKVIMDCPPKVPIKYKTKVNLPKPALIPQQRDTNIVNVEVKTGVKVYNDIIMPEQVTKTTILFSKGSLWEWASNVTYVTGATCFIIGASRHYEKTYITLNGQVLVNEDNLKRQQKEQTAWFIAGGTAFVTGLVFDWLGWRYTNIHFTVTPKSIGVVIPF